MIDCDDMLSGLHHQTCDHIALALAAETPPVAAMHIDLALFSAEQRRVAEEICEEE